MNLLKYIKNKKYNYRKIAFYGVFISLAILKLFIISNNEILALNLPHDDLWYINSANHLYWFGTYTQMKFIHLPVFPIFIYFMHFTTIPLRIIMEILFISSSFYFTYSLMKAGINKFFGLAIFILIIFHPLSIELFNHTLAETFYAPLLIFSIANLIMLWLHKEDRSSIYFSILTGISFALLWFTRDENILIAALFGLVFLIIIIISYLEKFSKKKIFDLIKKIIIIPAVCITILAIIINSANYLAFGVFAPSELQGSGYKSAYKALLKIKPSETIRYVSITTEAREKAYEVSPAFNQLRPMLENQSNLAFNSTKLEFNINNEMGAGWFYWVLREAVYQTGYKTGKSADQFYNQVAKEINQAINEKKIESRFVPFGSFMDPYFYKFLPNLPASFLKISKLLFETNKPPLERDAIELPNEVITLVDKMANRRLNIVKQLKIGDIQGWAFIDGEKIKKITLKNDFDINISETEELSKRQDVYDYYKKTNPTINVPINTGFFIPLSEFKNGENAYIQINYNDGSFQIPIKSIKLSNIIEKEDTKNNKIIRFAIDNISYPISQVTILQGYDWKIYNNIIIYLSILGLIFIIIIIATYKYIKNNNLLIILFILLFVIFTRILLFSIIDISSWNGAQPRYIFPIMPLYSTALLIIIYLGWKGVISKIKDYNKLK